jgi:hypothetical protein
MSEPEQINNLDINRETSLELVKLLYSGSKFRPVLHLVSIIILVSILIGEVPPFVYRYLSSYDNHNKYLSLHRH